MSTDLKDLLDSALVEAPPARFDVERAMRSGRLRRRARTTGGLLSGTAVVGAIAVGAWSLNPATGHGNREGVQPGGAPVSHPGNAATATADHARLTLRQLRTLARAVATPAGGKIVVTDPGSSGHEASRDRNVGLRVGVPSGAFVVGITSEPRSSPNSLATIAGSCARTPSQQAADGKACKALLLTKKQGAFQFTFTSQAGRQALWLVTTRANETVTVVIDNYTYVPRRQAKLVGPAWDTTGISVASIRAAVASIEGAGR